MKTHILWASVLVLMMSALGYCNYPGDCNGDMVVDDFDFNLVVTNFGNNYLPINGPGDCWQDGVVDDFDFNAVITNFGADYRNISPGEMVYIPAGEFLMGNNGNENGETNELPQHWVTLSGYWIGKYEVTRGEYRQFMNAGGYSDPTFWSTIGWSWKDSRTQPDYWAPQQTWGFYPTFTQTESHPVVGVSYYEAEAFCNWAGGHLPTEAQWEKSARWAGIHPNVFPWGDSLDYQQRCNNWEDSLYPGYQTAPVGIYASGASPYGCQDMAGNVWEWCQDWYKSYPGAVNRFDNTGSDRIMRGGGYYGNPNYCRAAYRGYTSPGYVTYWGGFRLARD